MHDPKAQKIISQIINQHLSDIPLHTGLLQLEEICTTKNLTYSSNISKNGKLLTKKIFAADVKCIKDNNVNNSKFHSHLKAFSFIFLHICFQDEHIMTIFLQEIKQIRSILTTQSIPKIEGSQLKVGKDDLIPVLAELIKKVSQWQKTFSISDIFGNYFLAVELITLFLIAVLSKLKYKEEESEKQRIRQTGEIYAILSDYFDLNMMMKGPEDLIRKKSKSQDQLPQHNGTQIYFFTDARLFISTFDNEEFCMGRYYDTEQDMLRSEKSVRKSTLEYILNKKQVKKENSSNSSQENDKEKRLHFSQMEMDLGASSSGFIFPNQEDSPYFNSNAPTPEFGSNLMDSLRFKKNADNGIGAFQHTMQKHQNLKIVEEQLEASNQNIKKNSIKDSLVFVQQTFNLKLSNFQEENEGHQIPKSPPSRQNRKNQVQSISHYRQSSFVNSQFEGSLIFDPNGNQSNRRLDGYKQCESERDNQLQEISKNKKKERGGEKTAFSHKNIPYQYQKQDVFMRKNTFTNENNTRVGMQKYEKEEQIIYHRKDKYDRKYSVNYQDTGVLNKNIYNSNHLQMEKMTKSSKTKNPNNFVFQDSERTLSEKPTMAQPKRKIQLASNIININLKIQQNETYHQEISSREGSKSSNLGASSDFLVISKQPGQGGFKKKRSEQDFLAIGNLNKVLPSKASPLSSKRKFQTKRDDYQGSFSNVSSRNKIIFKNESPPNKEGRDKKVTFTRYQKTPINRGRTGDQDKIDCPKKYNFVGDSHSNYDENKKNVYKKYGNYNQGLQYQVKNYHSPQIDRTKKQKGQNFNLDSPNSTKKFPQFLRQKNGFGNAKIFISNYASPKNNEKSSYKDQSRRQKGVITQYKKPQRSMKQISDKMENSDKQLNHLQSLELERVKEEVRFQRSIHKIKNTQSNPNFYPNPHQKHLKQQPIKPIYTKNTINHKKISPPKQQFHPLSNFIESPSNRQSQGLTKMKEPACIPMPQNIGIRRQQSTMLGSPSHFSNPRNIGIHQSPPSSMVQSQSQPHIYRYGSGKMNKCFNN